MRKICVYLLIFVFLFSLKAQDKIITTKKDTVFCKIVSISPSRIFYEQIESNRIVGKSISLDDVAEYFRKEQATSAIQSTPDNLRVPKRIKLPPAHPWILGVSVGRSRMPWLLSNIDDQNLANNYQKLKNGIHLDASVHYLLTDWIGAGLQYSYFSSKYVGNNIRLIEASYPIYITDNNKVRQYINYIGPSVLFQQYLDQKRKFKLSETLSEGLMFYRNEEQMSLSMPSSTYYYTNNYNVLSTGMSLGSMIGISAEYYLFPYMSVGIGGKFMYSKLSKMSSEMRSAETTQKFNDQKLEYPLNLSRIDYSLVLRFHL